MNAKLDFSQETSPISPTRIFSEHYSNQTSSKKFVLNPSAFYTTRMSETESEIYSHGLIREVMDTSRAKSIWHDINRIDEKSALYSVPLAEAPFEYHFDSIPPKNQLYLSACSATIKNISQGLIPDHPPRVNEQKTPGRKRPASAITKMDTHNKKISVSGLVTYKFNSLLAKKSLGFNLVNHEEQMLKDMKQAHSKLHCSRERGNRILERTNGQRFRKSQKDEKAIMSEFQTDTDSYLKKVVAEREENTIIYSQRTKRVNCIREYMEQQKVDYDVAVHAISVIDANHKKQVKPAPKVQRKIVSEEMQLNRRRTPTKRKSVLVRNFYFIE